MSEECEVRGAKEFVKKKCGSSPVLLVGQIRRD